MRSTNSKNGHRCCDPNCASLIGSCRRSQCCEPTAEERGAGKPHATFCGNRRRATASGDPVGGAAKLPPIPIAFPPVGRAAFKDVDGRNKSGQGGPMVAQVSSAPSYTCSKK